MIIKTELSRGCLHIKLFFNYHHFAELYESIEHIKLLNASQE